MGHADILTFQEWKMKPIDDEIFKHVKAYQSRMGKNNSQIRILDWGCGRGGSVLHFLEKGYDAYGIDVSRNTIERGRSLFFEMGYDFDSRIVLFENNECTSYLDNFFDFVVSYQVFEHVNNMESIAKEISRITSLNGFGIHIFPGKYRLREGHLIMPLIHWLPKNNFRKYMIIFFVLLGVEPKWNQLKKMNYKQKGNIYFDFSVYQTFYRSKKEIFQIFTNYGFSCYDRTIDHDKLKSLFGKTINYNFVRCFIGFVIPGMTSVTLTMEKMSI